MKIEGWSDEAVDNVDESETLYRASVLADQFEVTPQTIRNYGRNGLFRQIKITPRTVRYAVQVPTKSKSEAKTNEYA